MVLSRTIGERIVIGPDIMVTILDIGRGRVRLGIEAPRQWSIRRMELAEFSPAVGREPLPTEELGAPDASSRRINSRDRKVQGYRTETASPSDRQDLLPPS